MTAKVEGEKHNYEQLQSKVESSKEELENIQSDTDSAKGELDEIKNKLSENKEKYEELEKLASNREEVERKVSKSESKLTTLKKDIKRAENGLENIRNAISEAKGEPIEISAGHFTIGEDLKPRRYKVTPVNGSGNFFVDSDEYKREVGITLGNRDNAQPSYVFKAVSGDKIRLGVRAKFTPVE